jgi:hypothetical protein
VEYSATEFFGENYLLSAPNIGMGYDNISFPVPEPTCPPDQRLDVRADALRALIVLPL